MRQRKRMLEHLDEDIREHIATETQKCSAGFAALVQGVSRSLEGRKSSRTTGQFSLSTRDS
jgi:hypothetical protein